MQSITDVVNANNEVTASEFKEVCGEEENLILSSGQALSQADLGQIAKAVAVYAARGDAYDDNGTVNNINLIPKGTMKYPPSYVAGMRVRFVPAYTNTSASVNMRIGSLTSKPISAFTLDPGPGVPLLAVNYLDVSRSYTAVYHDTGSIQYWLLDNTVQTGDLNANSVDSGAIATGAVTPPKIPDLSISASKIGTAAVTSSKVQDLSISASKIGAAAVTASKIGGGAVGSTQLLNGAVTYEKLSNDLVDKLAIIDVNSVTFTQSGDHPWLYFATSLAINTGLDYETTGNPIYRLCSVCFRDTTNPSDITWRSCPASVVFKYGGPGNTLANAIYVYGPLPSASDMDSKRLHIYYRGV